MYNQKYVVMKKLFLLSILILSIMMLGGCEREDDLSQGTAVTVNRCIFDGVAGEDYLSSISITNGDVEKNYLTELSYVRAMEYKQEAVTVSHLDFEVIDVENIQPRCIERNIPCEVIKDCIQTGVLLKFREFEIPLYWVETWGYLYEPLVDSSVTLLPTRDHLDAEQLFAGHLVEFLRLPVSIELLPLQVKQLQSDKYQIDIFGELTQGVFKKNISTSVQLNVK